MNKYQREKIKRMKKMASLGVGYHQQKALLRKYNFDTYYRSNCISSLYS